MRQPPAARDRLDGADDRRGPQHQRYHLRGHPDRATEADVIPSPRRRIATSDDSGSVLVIALAIVTVIALVIGGVLSYADSNMRATVAFRTESNAAATAEGAAQAALDTLDQNEFINQSSSTTPDCFGATGATV